MIDLYEYINRNIIFPLYHKRHNDPRLKQLSDLEKNQFLSHDELMALSWNKFKKLLVHAYNHTVYYNELLNDLSKTPDDFNCFADIQILPVLTKDILRERQNDLISNKFNKSELILDTSGGSTGVPTEFYKDTNRNNIRRADQIRHDRWSGWNIGKKYALLWGAPKDNQHYNNLKERIYFRYIERNIILDAFDISDEKYSEFTNRLENYKPSMILGYANLLYQYALYLTNKCPDHNIRPDGIVSSAETLTSDMRKVIEDTFQCKVLNRYGSREVGLIASECKSQKGLHINIDNIYAETVDSDHNSVSSGVEGNILVTDYYNFAMPLIRYELGDVGVMSSSTCDCGRSLPLLEKVVGRKSDFFVTKTSKLIHGEYFTHLFYGLSGVKQFQIIQDSLDQITINIVKVSDVDLSTVILNIKQKMDDDITIVIHYMDKIMPSASGKYLFTKSNVSI